MSRRLFRAPALTVVSALILGGCGFSPYQLPLPGGADLGSEPYTVTIQFRDVLDLVPQSAVRVNDIAVGKVSKIELDGWTAVVTVKVNRDAKLPDNAVATIRQTSLLGEKFVSLAPPANGALGSLGDGDTIGLDRSSRNPEIEEVLGAASLLFNGGGLEKTNTIVRELNDALGGNEPEIKELIATTSSFIGQLDENKEALLTSLEKINRLAIATDEQTDAITGALDELPEALEIVDDQRDELVGLLESLDRLGDVATDVIRESKDDTVADLKALVPTLRNLTKAGDDVATSLLSTLSFPFTDGFVGGNIAAASGRCQDEGGGLTEIKEGACFGDFANLSLRLDLGADDLETILGDFSIDTLLSPDVKVPTPAPTTSTPTSPVPSVPDVDTPQDLADLVTGLLPGSGRLPSLGSSDEPGSATTPTPKPTASPTSGGVLCGLFACRTAVADEPSDDLRQLLVEPVVAP